MKKGLKLQQTELQKEEKKANAKQLYSLTVKPGIKQTQANNNLFAILPDAVTERIFMKDYVELLKHDLRDWVKEHADKIDLKHLCSNPHNNAMKIIENKNPDLLDWHELSKNPFAIDILSMEENYERIEWGALSSNKDAIDLLNARLLKFPSKPKIDWGNISVNENGYDMILQRIFVEKGLDLDRLRPHQKLDRARLFANKSTDVLNYLMNPKYKEEKSWYHLSGNSNPIAIKLLEDELRRDPNSSNINWRQLSGNPGAVKLLKAELKREPNSTKIHWNTLSGNAGVGIMEIIRWKIQKDGLPENDEYGKNQLTWHNLSSNPKAIFLLRDNVDKIKWGAFSTNPAIFSLNAYNSKQQSSRLLSSSSPLPPLPLPPLPLPPSRTSK